MDRSGVENSINRFITSFDTKDWSAMASTLAKEISIDYSDLRGEPASVSTRSKYIELRKLAHGHTKTHHLLSNLDIEIVDEQAFADASCMIFRTNEGESFNSHALYHFELRKVKNHWVITAIQQKILWNDGNPEMHKGVPQSDS